MAQKYYVEDVRNAYINDAAEEWLRPYLRYYVIYGETYPELKTRRNIPCGKDIFYNAFRRFLYILSERR